MKTISAGRSVGWSGRGRAEQVAIGKMKLALTVDANVEINNLGLGIKRSNMDHLFNFRGNFQVNSPRLTRGASLWNQRVNVYGVQGSGAGMVRGDFFAVTNLNQQVYYGYYNTSF